MAAEAKHCDYPSSSTIPPVVAGEGRPAPLLLQAAACGLTAALLLLLALLPPGPAGDCLREPALYAAARKRNDAAVELLVEATKAAVATDRERDTPLHWAAERGAVACAATAAGGIA